MRKQRNMAQMKEQNKTSEKELNEMEISNLSGAEFKTLAIQMLKEFSENLSNIKKMQLETKDTLIEIKKNLQGNNNKADEAENHINYLEHKEAKNNQSEWQEEKRVQKNEDSVSSLWDDFKQSNMCFIGVPKEKRKNKKLEIYLKK